MDIPYHVPYLFYLQFLQSFCKADIIVSLLQLEEWAMEWL